MWLSYYITTLQLQGYLRVRINWTISVVYTERENVNSSVRFWLHLTFFFSSLTKVTTMSPSLIVLICWSELMTGLCTCTVFCQMQLEIEKQCTQPDTEHEFNLSDLLRWEKFILQMYTWVFCCGHYSKFATMNFSCKPVKAMTNKKCG